LCGGGGSGAGNDLPEVGCACEGGETGFFVEDFFGLRGVSGEECVEKESKREREDDLRL